MASLRGVTRCLVLAVAILFAAVAGQLVAVSLAASAEDGLRPTATTTSVTSYDVGANLVVLAADGVGRSSGDVRPDSTALERPLASSGVFSAPRGLDAGTDLLRYDPDFAGGQLTRNVDATASQLADFGAAQGWKPVQSATGPLRFVDENGIFRLTIKRGSPRAPGSGFPHVEIRNAAGQRIDAFGNLVTRRSPGNHTPIIWDLP